MNEFDDDEEEESRHSPEMMGRLAELKRRCEIAQIEMDGPEHDMDFDLSIHFPEGRGKHAVRVGDLDHVNRLLGLQFENYRFLAPYEAICSYEERLIQANLSSLGSVFFQPVISRLRNRLFSGGREIVELQRSSDSQGVRCFLRAGSHALSNAHSGLSLELRDVPLSNHDQAVDILEIISDSVFFELDARFDISIGLRRNRRPVGRVAATPDNLARRPLEFPVWKYDKKAISLYWYGRSATGMPLLQFLAFYQVAEFYFSIHSQSDAIKRVRHLLKDPQFSINDDSDMSQVLTSIQINRAGGFGDEKAQLRATVQACVDSEKLRSFLKKERLRDFFSTGQWKAISEEKINLKNADADQIRASVADRIYDIRCKIVHAKADGGPSKADLLLPFSKEADLMGFDIEVARFVAQAVLVTASTTNDL